MQVPGKQHYAQTSNVRNDQGLPAREGLLHAAGTQKGSEVTLTASRDRSMVRLAKLACSRARRSACSLGCNACIRHKHLTHQAQLFVAQQIHHHHSTHEWTQMPHSKLIACYPGISHVALG